MFAFYKRIALWKKIFVGLILGLIVGLMFKNVGLELRPLGTLFINLIKMLIVPLIFCTLVSGISSMKDFKQMRRIGIKTLALYLISMAVAITIGILIAHFVKPGEGISLANIGHVTSKAPTSIINTLLDIVTKNPMNSLANARVLQIIFFAIILGICITLAGEKGKPVAKFFDSFSEVMFKMTHIVIAFAPYGVFGLMAWVSASYGVDVLLSLAKVIFCVYLACIIHVVFILGGGIAGLARLSPLKFFKGIISAQSVAFTTTSSSGTLPVTTANVTENFGVSRPIASFVLPLGATINMDGTAIYQGVCAIFIAQAFGVDLSYSNYVTIIFTSTLAAIGTAGIPGAGLIMLSLVLSSVGLPLEGVAIIAGIDRILDMIRTAVNVTGDAMVSVIVAKSENEIDLDIYNSSKSS